MGIKSNRRLLVILAEPVNPYYWITGKTGEPLKEDSEVCPGFAPMYYKGETGTAATGKPMKNGQRPYERLMESPQVWMVKLQWPDFG